MTLGMLTQHATHASTPAPPATRATFAPAIGSCLLSDMVPDTDLTRDAAIEVLEWLYQIAGYRTHQRHRRLDVQRRPRS
jgi:hypothetical protein